MAHCRRELMQAVWKYMLDDDFIHAMKYGIVVMCHDGVERRIYPRIFTYSADYPEKSVFFFVAALVVTSCRVLLATIRDNGLCPCPRCLTPKTKLDRMGCRWDVDFRLKSIRRYLIDKVQQARRIVYGLGQAVAGAGVDGVLKETSSVPTIVSALSSITIMMISDYTQIECFL